MKWEDVTTTPEPPPERKSVTTVGPFELSVTLATNGEQTWCYLFSAFGKRTDSSYEKCLEKWPAEVAAMLREAADKLCEE